MPWAGEISRVPQVNDDGLMGREGIRTDEGRKGPLKCHVKGPPKQENNKNAKGRKKKTEKNKKRSTRKAEKRNRSTKKLSEIRLESVQIVGNKGTSPRCTGNFQKTRRNQPRSRKERKIKRLKGRKKLEEVKSALYLRKRQKKKSNALEGRGSRGREGKGKGPCKAGQSPFQNLPQS